MNFSSILKKKKRKAISQNDHQSPSWWGRGIVVRVCASPGWPQWGGVHGDRAARRSPCSPQGLVNPLACCLGLGRLWPSPCYSIVIGRTGLGGAGPSASQPLPVPVVFLQEPELMGLSLGMLSLASLLGVRAAGSRVEVLLSVLLPGPRLAVSPLP